MAATVPVDTKGGENPLLEQAYAIGRPPEDTDTKTETPATTGNEMPPGSFERFMASFGSPQRWAGR